MNLKSLFKKEKDLMAIDFCEGNLVVAKFSYENGIVLRDFKTVRCSHSYEDLTIIEPANALKDVIKGGINDYRNARICIDDQMVFPRFITLPPIAEDKLQQIVRYEAEQNVPFPIEEVAWDFHINSSNPSAVTALIVAVKNDNIDNILSQTQAVRIKAKSISPRTISILNSVRSNLGSIYDIDYSYIVMDIGERSTSIIFIENNKFFIRSIPVGCNTIVQELSKHLDIPFADAEAIRMSHNNIPLEDVPVGDTSTGAVVHKNTRNVMTRLHAELNRSINFYRSQQKGSIPSNIWITGLGSKISGMSEFFSDKTKVTTSIFDPFGKMISYPSIIGSNVRDYKYTLHGVVGLALQEYTRDLVNINLIDPSKVRKIKKPEIRTNATYGCRRNCPFRKC
jgi:type IV pilus assembly protein PilM